MNQAEIICTLLIAVAALAMLAKKVALPYPVLLVIGGLALGFVPGLPAVKLEPDLVFLFLLPPLLYPAALFTSWRDSRQRRDGTRRLPFRYCGDDERKVFIFRSKRALCFSCAGRHRNWVGCRLARCPSPAPSRRSARSNHDFAAHAVCRLYSCGAPAGLQRTGSGRVRAVSRVAWAANLHLSDAAQLVRVLGDDGVPVERPGLRSDRSPTAAHSSYALRPLSETVGLAWSADKLCRHCCAHRLGFSIDLPAAFDECFLAQKRPVSGMAERGDRCLDRDARRCVARGCARGAADALGWQPFPRTRLHFVHHILRDSRDARAPRSDFARADSPAWSGG